MPLRYFPLALAALAAAPAFAQGAIYRVQTYRVYPAPVESPIHTGVFDVLGRAVATVEEVRAPGRHEVLLDMSGLAAGTYVLRLATGTAARAHRFTVVR